MRCIGSGSKRLKLNRAGLITASKPARSVARSTTRSITSSGAAAHIRGSGVVRFGGVADRPSSKLLGAGS